MNLEHLKLFTRIASLQNISLAGKEQGLSPAVSSTYVNKLEESLGVRLVHRTTRRVSLTEEGLTFLPHALQVLENVEQAKSAVGAGQSIPQGKLRVTAPASFGRMHLLPALADFLCQFPNLSVDLNLSDKIIDLVEGGYDIAIRDASLNDSSLIARKLANDRRFIFASPSYIEKYGEPKTPEELSKHRCINLMGLEHWQFIVNGETQHIKTNNILRTDNGEAARDAAAAGIGITLSSTWCAYKHIKDKSLTPILTDFPLISDTNIWAVYPSSRLVAPKVRMFIDHFSNKFSESPYWEEGLSI
ncbi:LysR family transcriptional regulator [Glaciecola sp. 2405UD65-10]|uniref:LysR family transcriptional regulator n=1 Tax=Glaciecola sp. 2405UD65-10 TaxID=3397244 RepID=UPI003B58ECF5